MKGEKLLTAAIFSAALCSCIGNSKGKESSSVKGENAAGVTFEQEKSQFYKKMVEPFLKRWNVGILDTTPANDYVGRRDLLNGLVVEDMLLAAEAGSKELYGLQYYSIVQNSTGKSLGRVTARFIQPPCSLGQVRQEAVKQLLQEAPGAAVLRKGITHRFYGRDSWRMFLNGSPMLWCEGNFVGMLFRINQDGPDFSEALIKTVNAALRNTEKHGVEFHPDRAVKWREFQREERKKRGREQLDRRRKEDRTLGLSAWLYAIAATPERDWKWWKEHCRITDFSDPVTENRKLTCRLSSSCMQQWAKERKIIMDKKSQGWVAQIFRDDGFLLVAAVERESADLAKGMMVRFRFFNYRSPNMGVYRTYNQEYLSDEDARSSTVIHPGKVGDFDLGVQPVLSPAGVIVPNSENSAVYFVRGTTAVMVVTTIPNMSVLPVAKKLDELLLKQVSEAPVPAK